MTYRKDGATQTDLLGYPRPQGTPALYFVPQYSVHLATIEVPIGYDAGARVLEGVVPEEPELFENLYWVVTRVHLTDDGFPGEYELTRPRASAQLLHQGYTVNMPAGRSGVLSMEYHVVGPRGLAPPWQGSPSGFGELGSYTDRLAFGLPQPTGSIQFLPNRPWQDFPQPRARYGESRSARG